MCSSRDYHAESYSSVVTEKSEKNDPSQPTVSKHNLVTITYICKYSCIYYEHEIIYLHVLHVHVYNVCMYKYL